MDKGFLAFLYFIFVRGLEGQIVIRDVNRLPVIGERVVVALAAAEAASALVSTAEAAASLVSTAEAASALVSTAVAASALVSAAVAASALVSAAIAASALVSAAVAASTCVAAAEAASAKVSALAAACIVTTIQEAHAFRDNFCHADFLAFLVLVAADLETTVDSRHPALAQVLRAKFRLLLPDDDVDEVGLTLAVLPRTGTVYRQRELRNRSPRLGVAQFRIGRQTTDQDDAIQHGILLLMKKFAPAYRGTYSTCAIVSAIWQIKR
jgi:hypothetical protein